MAWMLMEWTMKDKMNIGQRITHGHKEGQNGLGVMEEM